MTFFSSLLFAKKFLFSKSSRKSLAKKSLWGAALCVGISLVPLVAIITISNGMINGITERLISLSSSHLEAASFLRDAELLQAAASSAKKIEGIQNAYPAITGQALAFANKKRCGVFVRALPSEIFFRSPSYKKLFFAEEGSIEDFAKTRRGALVGKGVSERLGVKAGDTIRIASISSSEKNSENAFFLAPKISSYKICGVISCGYQELDSLWLFVDFEEGKTLLSSAQSEALVMMETSDAFSPSLPALQKKAQAVLGGGFRVLRWDQMNRSQYENFSSTKILLVFIQLLIVLVACVNISSALSMLVLERRSEIAILKSLGASREGVRTAFLACGFACGALGVLLGVPAGLFISVNINRVIFVFEKVINFFAGALYFFSKGGIMEFQEIRILNEAYYLKEIPVEIPFGELLLISLSAMLLSLLASSLPAKKAARQSPLEILRVTR